MRWNWIGAGVVCGALAAASPAQAALNSYIQMSSPAGDLECFSSRTEMGGVDVTNHIEAFSVVTGLIQPLRSDGAASGPPQHRPLRIRKRVDKCTPLLHDLLLSGAAVSAVIKFFDNDPSTGATKSSLTITLTNARVVGVSVINPDTLGSETASLPSLEEVSLAVQTIVWEHSDGTAAGN